MARITLTHNHCFQAHAIHGLTMEIRDVPYNHGRLAAKSYLRHLDDGGMPAVNVTGIPVVNSGFFRGFFDYFIDQGKMAMARDLEWIIMYAFQADMIIQAETEACRNARLPVTDTVCVTLPQPPIVQEIRVTEKEYSRDPSRYTRSGVRRIIVTDEQGQTKKTVTLRCEPDPLLDRS